MGYPRLEILWGVRGDGRVWLAWRGPGEAFFGGGIADLMVALLECGRSLVSLFLWCLFRCERWKESVRCIGCRKVHHMPKCLRAYLQIPYLSQKVQEPCRGVTRIASGEVRCRRSRNRNQPVLFGLFRDQGWCFPAWCRGELSYETRAATEPVVLDGGSPRLGGVKRQVLQRHWLY